MSNLKSNNQNQNPNPNPNPKAMSATFNHTRAANSLPHSCLDATESCAWLQSSTYPGVQLSHASVAMPDGSAHLSLNVQFDPQQASAATQCLRRLQQQAAQHCTFWLFALAFVDVHNAQIASVLRDFNCGVQLLSDHQDSSLACVQLWAVQRPLETPQYSRGADGSVCACHDDGWFKYYWMTAGLPRSSQLTTSLPQAVPAAFESLSAFLPGTTEGLKLLQRTWIYLPQLLQCYDAFNLARNALFERCGLFESGVPSSTGISAANAANTAISLSALALQPSGEHAQVRAAAVPSPLQCPAYDYRSAFARAHRIDTPHYSRLLVSGTAAIWPDGISAWRGNIGKQVELTMQVIEAMLEQQGMHWGDGVRALVYLKQPQYQADFVKWQQQCRTWPDSIALGFVHADVCRDELLFEIEMDFLKPIED